MKYFKRKNEWRNSTGSNRLDVETRKAYSYDWWCYFTPLEGTDKFLFNDYSYSNSTSKHQNDLRSLLRNEFCLGYDSERIIYVDIRDSLTGTKEDIKKHIKVLVDEIKELKEAIKKPRTQKKKNLERMSNVNSISDKVLELAQQFELEIDTNDLYMSNAEYLIKSAKKVA